MPVLTLIEKSGIVMETDAMAFIEEVKTLEAVEAKLVNDLQDLGKKKKSGNKVD